MKKDIILISIIAAFFSIYFLSNANNEGFDQDEAGQFWMAKGLNHYSNILAKNGDFANSIINNRNYNLDPGGFTIILRFWTFISNDILWLKFLPFVFFTLFCFYFIKTIYLLTNNWNYSLIGIILIIVVDNVFNFITYLRPYSMEYFGAAFALYLLLKTQAKLTKKELFQFGLIMCLFAFSRYTFSVNIVAISLLIIRTDQGIKQNIKKIIWFNIPIISAYLIIWFVTLQYQNPSLKAPGLYHVNLLFSHPELFFELFNWNFLNIRSFPFTLLIMFFLLRQKIKIDFPVQTSLFIKWGLIVHIILLVFSIVGASPWDIRDQRSTYLYLLSILSLIIIMYTLFGKLNIKTQTSPITKWIIRCPLILIVFYHIYLKIGFKRDISDNIILEQEGKTFTMDKYNYSNIKYYFRFGTLKNEPIQLFNRINFIHHLEEFDGKSFPVYLYNHRYMIHNKELTKYNYKIISTEISNKAFPFHKYLIINGFKH
jgi:hypothetical protein